MSHSARLLMLALFVVACAHVDSTPPMGEPTEGTPAESTPDPKPKPKPKAAPDSASAPEAKPGAKATEKAGAGRPDLAPTPEGLMVPGAIEKIQTALRSKGLLNEDVNGKLDEPTSSALREFQKNEKLARTGVPDRETLRHLGLKPNDLYKKPAEQEQQRRD